MEYNLWRIDETKSRTQPSPEKTSVWAAAFVHKSIHSPQRMKDFKIMNKQSLNKKINPAPYLQASTHHLK
jgi:hypothetical protein